MCTLDGCGPHADMPPIIVAENDRRAFLAGALSLPLATVLAYPEFAAAQAASLQDISIKTANGRTATGVIALPESLPAPTILLIHEWWGLNDQIKAVAAEFAALGYIALAIDLYDGEMSMDPAKARALMGAMDSTAAKDKLAATVAHLRNMQGSTGKLGTVGWCFGGGWSLNASLVAPVDATVIYYGSVTPPASALAKLHGPVMGHFGTEDGFINGDMVAGFEAEMAKAGKAESLTVHWYNAHHAFANPSGARYDQVDAALAWQRTTAFFTDNLQG